MPGEDPDDACASFFAALAQVQPALGRSDLHALLSGAQASGLLERVRDGLPLVVDGVDAGVLEALAAHGVAEACPRPGGPAYRLAPAWARVADPAAPMPLAALLARVEARAGMLRRAAAGHTFWSSERAERLAYAAGVSLDPFSPLAPYAARAFYAADAEVAEALDAARDALELGCGVAGRILSTAQAYPHLRQTGVELAPDLADEARRRAGELGVAHRVRILTADATDLDHEGSYDFGFWAQFFFAEAARPAALATLHRALRPAAMVMAPVLGPGAHEGDPDDERLLDAAAERVLHQAWGVPPRTADELAEELRSAGFAQVRVVPGATDRVVARRP